MESSPSSERTNRVTAASEKMAAPSSARRPGAITPAEARAIAKEAYIYGFPLVDSYRIQYAYFVDRGGPEYKAPWNRIYHNARVYTPDDKVVQTPNADTPYSYVGADLRAEPLVLSVPAVEAGRYYSVQLVDMYTFDFAYVGSRATGNDPGRFLLTGPGWQGDAPDGVDAIIRCETELAFILYRTQLFDPEDIENVQKVQAGYEVQPLSHYLGKRAPPAPPRIDFMKPLAPEQQRTSLEFFGILSFVLQFCPTHPSEQGLRERFARLGIVPGSGLDTQQWPPEIQMAVAEGMADAWRELAELKTTQIDTGKVTSADGFGTREHLKNDYLLRMASAVYGIYGNAKEEAVYPAYFTDSEGEKLDASKRRYELRFAPGALPPVNAFWSVTLYELPSSLLVKNPIDRFLINSTMLPELVRGADGGLTLYLQHDPPGANERANWLPAPSGPFFAVLRLYWPKQEALDGTWKAPALVPASTEAATGVPVTVESFRRAETDAYFGLGLTEDGFGKLKHHRELAPIDAQPVIRMNRDTLYSSGVFDLDAGPVTITLPDPGARFMSLQLIDEDHYTPGVFYTPGRHTITKEGVGTRYVFVIVRTFVDPTNPADLGRVHALQDAIGVEQKSPGRFEVPKWDRASHQRVRDALLVLGATVPDTRRMFGAKAAVDPIRHLIGTALGWGGNPEKDAMYLNVTPRQNDGVTPHELTVGDVPVDGFWSISVYNAEGYFEPNPQHAYSLNDVTAKRSADGSITIRFGAAHEGAPNTLPIMPGWNYTVRLYRPRQEVLDGTWTFPEARPVR